MKKRKKYISIVLLGIIAVAIIASVFIFRKKAEYVSEVNEKDVNLAFSLLNESLNTDIVTYTDFLHNNTVNMGNTEKSTLPEGGTPMGDYNKNGIILDYKDKAKYKITLEDEGLYFIALDFKAYGNSLADFNIDVKVNGEQAFSEMKNIILPLTWMDETKDFPVDRYQDETSPPQIRQDTWKNIYLYNNTYYTSKPLLIHLHKGENIISITNVSNNGLGLGELRIEAPKNDTKSYVDYRKSHKGTLVTDLLNINSTEYIEKNTTGAMYSVENNPILTPHDSKYKKINVLSWTDAGSEITYKVEIPKEGFYQIAMHYKNPKQEFGVFNTIKIDGEVPFSELYNYVFDTTGNSWDNEVLSNEDGIPFEIFFTEGTHTITFRAEQEKLAKAYRYARLIAEHVTQFELEITKITGSIKDKNRTWKMVQYIPDIAAYLDAYDTLIHYIKYTLQEYTPNGVNSAIFSELDKATVLIKKMAKYPDEIALYKEDLTGKDNSVLTAMATFSSDLVKQNYALDMIYVYGNKKLPRAKASVFAAVGNNLKGLFSTFTSDKYDVSNEEDSLNIWVNRALTHVDLLQKMVDSDFTAKTGIKVKISAMPDANKLTLAASAKETPDVALGIQSHMPFDLASRGALYDLTQFDDFWSVANRFVPGSFVSYLYNEGVYAIPETLNFHSVIYRRDILENLGLTPPDTWGDVVDMLPTLQRFGMNFYHNISTGDGYKWFHQTAPLIFQNGGKLYSENGLKTAIDEPNAVKGLQALGNLFIAYSLDAQVNSFFNSFRSSTLPIGIVDLESYILIKNGAPELDGQWELSAYPGTENADGTVDRWYIANGTGGLIFNESKKVDESWAFLKWWTEYETQIDYTYTLRSTYGKQFVWMSSNVDAVKDSPFPQGDKEVILEQIKWLRDVPRTPGQYLLERSLSDIWNDMVFKGISAQVAVDEKSISINREIRKKMSELGFYDEEGNLLKSYVIHDIDWIKEQMEKAGKEVK
jgi:ABC-type glycerol-3-phosphate transport system substrate-binding protein